MRRFVMVSLIKLGKEKIESPAMCLPVSNVVPLDVDRIQFLT
ncbi:hypothetical protein SCOR_14735 [Sulfidibacter corallicola]